MPCLPLGLSCRWVGWAGVGLGWVGPPKCPCHPDGQSSVACLGLYICMYFEPFLISKFFFFFFITLKIDKETAVCDRNLFTAPRS